MTRAFETAKAAEIVRRVRGMLGITLSFARGSRLFPAARRQAPGKEPAPGPAPPAGAEDAEQPLPGDWGPELLDGILSSSNEEAQYALLRATFAAGPAIIPQLTAGAEGRSHGRVRGAVVGFIGGDQALAVLWKLLSDPRDLNLRRFTYGALAEYDSPQATDMLFDVINKSDDEPDRTVTESAVIALTVRTDTALLPRLLAAEKKLQDVVIRDDLDNARAVIEERAKYLASPEGKKSGGSIESAVRTYFIPALEPPSAPETAARCEKAAGKPATPPAHAEPRPQVKVDVRNVTLSPDKNRALARVVFEDPTAEAYYDFVLQKRSAIGPRQRLAGTGGGKTRGGHRRHGSKPTLNKSISLGHSHENPNWGLILGNDCHFRGFTA